jgi:hypothetical protein
LEKGERANINIEKGAVENIAVRYLTMDPTSIAPVATRLSLTTTPFSSFSFNSFFFALLLSPPLAINMDSVSRLQRAEKLTRRGASTRNKADDVVYVFKRLVG